MTLVRLSLTLALMTGVMLRTGIKKALGDRQHPNAICSQIAGQRESQRSHCLFDVA